MPTPEKGEDAEEESGGGGWSLVSGLGLNSTHQGGGLHQCRGERVGAHDIIRFHFLAKDGQYKLEKHERIQLWGTVSIEVATPLSRQALRKCFGASQWKVVYFY